VAHTRIFVRDDDVGALTPDFRGFFDAFAERGVPVSYQIIPEKLTEDCAAFLIAEQRRRPGLIDLGQHGLRHEMMVRGKLEYYEFGPERTYEQQLGDIRAGQALLRERLGEAAPITVFTPPRHRYDRNTLKALKAAGFQVLSASSYPGLKHRLAYGLARGLGLTNLGRPGVPWHGRVRPDSGLFELSVAVAADDGDFITASVDELMAGIAQARRHTDQVGVLFHHQAFAVEEGPAYLSAFIDRLRQLDDVSFHTLSGLYADATAP
jgi:hypothetical protein